VLVSLLSLVDDVTRGGRSARAGAGGDVTTEVRSAVEVAAGPGAVEVVRVFASGCGGRSIGSGVVLTGGRVLTARHVLDGADEATVVLANGERWDATYVAVDGAGRDSALLDVPGIRTDGSGAQVADRLPPPGSTVAVLGHPDGGATVTRQGALVGQLGSGPLSIDGGRVLTLDLIVDAGMSGGPVVDAEGRVLGVAIGADRATRTGIAVPIDALDDLLDGRGEPASRAC
jgi:S1-C subfamily serine protease